MENKASNRRLAVIVFTDIVGYTSMSRDRDVQILAQLLEDHDLFVRHAVDGLEGRVVKGTGDGYMIEFPTPQAAVEFAAEFQMFLRERRALKDPALAFRVRIGVHAGDVTANGGDLFGDAVNVTSRLESIAPPDGIMVSSAIRDMLRSAVFFGAGRCMSIAKAVKLLRIDRKHVKAALDERLDYRPARRFDCDGHRLQPAPASLRKLRRELAKTVGRVADLVDVNNRKLVTQIVLATSAIVIQMDGYLEHRGPFK